MVATTHILSALALLGFSLVAAAPSPNVQLLRRDYHGCVFAIVQMNTQILNEACADCNASWDDLCGDVKDFRFHDNNVCQFAKNQIGCHFAPREAMTGDMASPSRTLQNPSTTIMIDILSQHARGCFRKYPTYTLRREKISTSPPTSPLPIYLIKSANSPTPADRTTHKPGNNLRRR
ncbi:hypothetical protein BDK51DRAFT_33373 [Blyttiomyces helicus]|uniref:Uncharacterized protein n=1 Tax=Blyttiomyces helicus TaxID=388810 RepID=A0A4P9VZC4_9FUNG|nr:hypothetical protein BDK51DRAFT_33373 [Blyttiomyces helicus]|eukprot:RKO83700.1 hypothetical protein BDK51DRAFT_33373 [Blyttiomyces helicus]